MGKKKTDKADNEFEVCFERSALLNALRLVSLAAAKNSPKPVLESVFIGVTGGEARIRATDLDVAVEVKLTCKSKDIGCVILPCTQLLQAVARAEDDEVTIRWTEKYIELVTADGLYQFYKTNSKEFPDSAFGFSVEKGCEFKLADLRAATAKVLCAVSKEATGYALNGMLCEFVAGGINLVATNLRHLAKTFLKTGDLNKKSEAKRVIVSRRAAQLLAHIEAEEDTVCRVEFTDNHIFMSTDKVYLAGLLLEGTFPKYADVIPVGCEHSITLDAAAVTRQVRRAKILEGDGEDNRNIIISSENGRIEFEAENQEVGKACMQLAIGEAKNGQGDFEIAVRSKYLLDALKTLGEFRLEVNDSDQPLVLLDDDTVHVIMAVKN